MDQEVVAAASQTLRDCYDFTEEFRLLGFVLAGDLAVLVRDRECGLALAEPGAGFDFVDLRWNKND